MNPDIPGMLTAFIIFVCICAGFSGEIINGFKKNKNKDKNEVE